MGRFCMEYWLGWREESVDTNMDDCSMETIAILGNILCTGTVLVLLSYRWWCNINQGEHSKQIRTESRRQNLKIRHRGKFFHHHNSIWILTSILFLILLTQFSESLTVIFSNMGQQNVLPVRNISSNSSESGSESAFWIYNLRVWSPVSSIVTLSLISYFYQHIESTQESKYLWLNIIYFGFQTVIAITRLEYHLRRELTLLHVKVSTEISGGIGTMTLFILLVHALMAHRKQYSHEDGIELKNIKYLHNFSPLPSRISFYWFTSLLWLGYNQPLEEEDLGSIPVEETTKYQFNRFNRIYQKEKEASSPDKPVGLWKCMFKTLWSSLLIAGVFRLAADLSGFVAPLGIRAIVDYVQINNGTFKEEGPPMQDLTLDQLLSNGYVMAFVILLSAIFQSTFSQCSTFLVNSEGIRMKVALQALIYNKSLTLSPTKSSTGNTINGSADLGLSQEELPSSSKNEQGEPTSEDGMNSGAGFDNGSILHIVSEDTTNVMTFFWMVHFIWAIPLKLAILMGLLYAELGFSALVGAAICILLMIPLQFWIGKKMSLNSREMMERCDERLRSMSEILQGMKFLKVHGWELVFSTHLSVIRKKELKNLDRDLFYRSIMTFLTHISSVLVTVVTFGLYPYIETKKLEPAEVFAGLALFNQLTVPLFIFPITVPVVIDALVSVERIRNFLQLPEATSFIGTGDSSRPEDSSTPSPEKDTETPQKEKKEVKLKVPPCKNSDFQSSSDSVFGPIHEEEEEEEDEDGDEDELGRNCVDAPQGFCTISVQEVPEVVEEVFTQTKAKVLGSTFSPPSSSPVLTEVVSLENCDFSWEEDRHDQTLNQITTKIPKGKLTIVVGPIGCGKSSLLSAILGEIKLMKGTVQWGSDARVAYAAQKPWIQNGSVRENILFGKQFRPRRYKKVIEACSLQADIDILPAKDYTEIGEKGISLSGGQKQRIGIARALYHVYANVIILDDVLSALDVEIAQEVFNTGIKKYLLKAGKTVLLVTHHLPALTSADNIIALEKGRIRIQGTLQEIKKEDPELYADWQTIMTKKEAEIDRKVQYKTGKERWALLKLVSKIGHQFKNNQLQISWKNEDSVKPLLDTYKKKQGTFSAYRNLSHDMFLPNDDCHDEIMTPLLRRRTVSRQFRLSRDSRTSVSSNNKLQVGGFQKHQKLARMTSLQVEDSVQKRGGPAAVKRLQSLPVTEEPLPSVCPQPEAIRERADTLDSSVGQRPNFFKHLLSVNTKKPLSSAGSSATELDRIQRLTSTLSGASDTDYPEEGDEGPEYALLGREMSTEEREYGTIPLKVYMSYISACGRFLSFFYLLFALGYEVVRVYTNFWLKEWSDEVSQSSDDDYEGVMEHYFRIYVILSIVTVLVSLSSNLIGKQAGANSRERLHNKMLDRIVRCPMKFFDATPIGRLQNRFSSDVAVVDRKLCISTQRFLQFVFLCLSAIVVNAIVNPWFLIVAIPIVAIYYIIQRFYRFSSRELQRIEAISRGPIYSHFHETLEGLSTIRAFKQEGRFMEEMFIKIDTNNTAAMFINVGNRWLSISLDFLGSVIVYIATLVSMISSHLHPETVTPSMVGLAINYTLLVPVYLNWVVKFLAEVEMQITSVDRIDRFSEVAIEEYGDETGDTPPNHWPSSGQVEFENVSIQYAPDRPQIIHNLTLRVPAKQKVGICGRSGSGKSSLLMSLFRVSDVCEGRILIDGVDIYKVPLLRLRSSISIIPQENILFSGTIRFNLDPLLKVTDIEIWKALELAQMKEIVTELPGQLDAEIKDGGSSFSAGQKQLLGLARAILHNAKLVILDEATSSVDLGTEKILLKVVKEAFKDSTVLTIAHRLDTIIDGDRIIILDAGMLVEDGHPAELQQNPLSIFKTLMKHASEQGHLH